MAKVRLNAGDTMLNNSINEWHSKDGVAGRGLNTSSVDLVQINTMINKTFFLMTYLFKKLPDLIFYSL